VVKQVDGCGILQLVWLRNVRFRPVADIQRAVHSTTMQTSLQDMRQRLTSDARPAEVRFTSIRLEQPKGAGGRRAVRASAGVTFRLSVCPSVPTEIHGHLYQEDSGALLEELQANIERVSEDELLCSFVPPRDLLSARVCLVIEGRWLDQVAGCEMSFDYVGS